MGLFRRFPEIELITRHDQPASLFRYLLLSCYPVIYFFRIVYFDHLVLLSLPMCSYPSVLLPTVCSSLLSSCILSSTLVIFIFPVPSFSLLILSLCLLFSWCCSFFFPPMFLHLIHSIVTLTTFSPHSRFLLYYFQLYLLHIFTSIFTSFRSFQFQHRRILPFYLFLPFLLFG